jgi:hypothetical protein
LSVTLVERLLRIASGWAGDGHQSGIIHRSYVGIQAVGKTTVLRREIKTRFFPYAAARGFRVDLRLQPTSVIFRRPAGVRMEMFELQWDKYGSARFTIHCGACSIEGLEINGRKTPAEEALPTWCNEVASLQPRGGSGTRSWFRQDSTLVDRLIGRPALRNPSEVVDELLALFPEIEQYWAAAKIGPHLRIWRRDPSPRRIGA